jgi:DNA-binding MarR family transcriptional regulator
MPKRLDAGLAAGGGSRLKDPQPNYESLARFRFAIRQFLNYSDSIARAAGITSQQYQTLLAIGVRDNGEATTLKELAEEMLLLPHGAVQLVNRLETMKLVRRRKSPVDGRKVLVSLTVRGQRTLGRLAKDHAAELRRQEPLLAESLRRLRGMPG